MAGEQADKKTRDDLFEQSRRLQQAAMSASPMPMPQRTALKGQATALFEQWVELEAARFNADAQGYRTAITGVNAAIEELQREIDALNDAIRAVEKATAVIRAVDGLLKIAIEHLPIP